MDVPADHVKPNPTITLLACELQFWLYCNPEFATEGNPDKRIAIMEAFLVAHLRKFHLNVVVG